jgi:hypothetical protein
MVSLNLTTHSAVYKHFVGYKTSEKLTNKYLMYIDFNLMTQTTDQFIIQYGVDYALFLIDALFLDPSQEMFNYLYSNILCEKSQIHIFPRFSGSLAVTIKKPSVLKLVFNGNEHTLNLNRIYIHKTFNMIAYASGCKVEYPVLAFDFDVTENVLNAFTRTLNEGLSHKNNETNKSELKSMKEEIMFSLMYIKFSSIIADKQYNITEKNTYIENFVFNTELPTTPNTSDDEDYNEETDDKDYNEETPIKPNYYKLTNNVKCPTCKQINEQYTKIFANTEECSVCMTNIIEICLDCGHLMCKECLKKL